MPNSGGHNKGMPAWSDDRYRAKLRKRCTITETGCWEISGFHFQHVVPRADGKGYGTMCYRGKATRSHRLAWLLWKWPIPGDKWVLHRCDNPPCCNPDHLFLGTQTDNNKDMAAKGRYNYHRSHYTHCRNGHPLFGENVRITKQGFRACKTCQRIACRRIAGWPKELWNLPPQPKGQRP